MAQKENVELSKKENKNVQKQEKVKKPNIFKRFAKYCKDVYSEVKKLTWPTPKDLRNTTITVIVVVALFAIVIGVLDFVFGKGLSLLSSINIGA